MRYKKIYVISVSDIATGGPENLHQLVDELRNNGQDASIVYFPRPESAIPEAYKCYNINKSEIIEDSSDNAIVIPEHFSEYCLKFKKAKVFLWWLSYDYYFGELTRPPSQRLFRLKRFLLLIRMKHRGINHLFQSYYAQKQVENFGFKGQILSDYLNQDFLERTRNYNKPRSNNIIYNPVKGQYYNSIMVKSMDDITCMPIAGMTREEVIQLMESSSFYVDLGEHPGKDRMPREAALSGCTVIVARRGAAACNEDMPIDEIFKISLNNNFIKSLRNVISQVKASDSSIEFQKNYKEWILTDKARFQKQVSNIFM